MARVRLNSEYRTKVANRMRVHLEQENTQEKEKYLQLREQMKPLQDQTWNLAKEIVSRHYTPEDIKMAYHLQNKFENVDTIAKDSCFHFHYMGEVESRDYDNNPTKEKKAIEKHFDFRLKGSVDGESDSFSSDDNYGYALYRDEINAQEGCNADINIEQDGKERNPHLTKFVDANNKYLRADDEDAGYGKQWNERYQLDLIGREYCRDRQLGCDVEEFAILMSWQQAKQKLIMAHTKWIETILEPCKVLKAGLRDHVYLEQSIDMAKKMGLTISETDILATTSKGIVVSNQDILNHLASLKNKTQTREQKIALRKLYDQQQAK